MPVRRVAIDARAGKEMRHALRWYMGQNPTAAQRFQTAVDDVVQKVGGAAEQGVLYRHRFRWIRLHKFPYLVYYEIRDPQPVLIYALAHAHRRPGYWLRRTRP